MRRPEKGRGRNVLYFIRQQTLGKGERETRNFSNDFVWKQNPCFNECHEHGID